jgi:enoyl-CoA hydratase
MSVLTERRGPVTIVILDRPHRRNAIDPATATALADAFRAFDADADADVAVLWGAGGTFCAGADLHSVAEGTPHRFAPDGDAPLGPSRMALSKPVIAAIEGWAVAGGLELACWCDLRVAATDAQLGVLCRRWGVPLIDGGTARLPRLIGLSRALDLILTGRTVDAAEAHAMGLVNRLCPPGEALSTALALAQDLAALPQACLRSDRHAALAGLDLSLADALAVEFSAGAATLTLGEHVRGAAAFTQGAGRHGAPR